MYQKNFTHTRQIQKNKKMKKTKYSEMEQHTTKKTRVFLEQILPVALGQAPKLLWRGGWSDRKIDFGSSTVTAAPPKGLKWFSGSQQKFEKQILSSREPPEFRSLGSPQIKFKQVFE